MKKENTDIVDLITYSIYEKMDSSGVISMDPDKSATADEVIPAIIPGNKNETQSVILHKTLDGSTDITASYVFDKGVLMLVTKREIEVDGTVDTLGSIINSYNWTAGKVSNPLPPNTLDIPYAVNNSDTISHVTPVNDMSILGTSVHNPGLDDGITDISNDHGLINMIYSKKLTETTSAVRYDGTVFNGIHNDKYEPLSIFSVLTRFSMHSDIGVTGNTVDIRRVIGTDIDKRVLGFGDLNVVLCTSHQWNIHDTESMKNKVSIHYPVYDASDYYNSNKSTTLSESHSTSKISIIDSSWFYSPNTGATSQIEIDGITANMHTTAITKSNYIRVNSTNGDEILVDEETNVSMKEVRRYGLSDRYNTFNTANISKENIDRVIASSMYDKYSISNFSVVCNTTIYGDDTVLDGMDNTHRFELKESSLSRVLYGTDLGTSHGLPEEWNKLNELLDITWNKSMIMSSYKDMIDNYKYCGKEYINGTNEILK